MHWHRLLRSPWTAVAVTALAFVVILLGSAVAALDLLLFAAYIALGIALPGIFTWRVLLQRFHTDASSAPTWFEDLSLGTIFGFGLQLPVYLVGVVIGVPLIVIVLPIAVLAISATAFGRRIWALPTGQLDWRASWALSALSVYGVVWLAKDVFPLRPMWLAANKTPSIDETFHQALIAELSHHVPPQIPFLLGTRLDYHWFVHAQIATTRWVTHIDSVVLLRELFPALMLLLTTLGLAAVALRLTRRAVTAVLAPALLVVGGFNLIGPHFGTASFSEAFASKRYVSSPSQSYGAMMALPAIMLILEVLRPNQKPRRLTWIALTLTLFALSGAKATFMPIFLCGAIGLWLYQLVAHRKIDRTVSALVALLLVVTIFAQIVLFGGRSGAMTWAPFNMVGDALNLENIRVTPISSLAMAMSLLVGWLLYGVGAVGLVKRGRWRERRALWMSVSIATGVAVPFLFVRSGHAELWFQRSVSEVIVLLSVWGMAYLLPNPLTRRQAFTFAGVAASAGLAAFLVSSFIESQREVAGRATLGALALSALTPLVVVAVFLLVRFATGRWGARPRPGLPILITFLLGLSLTNVYALGYDIVTQHPPPPIERLSLFAAGGVDAAAYIKDHSTPDEIVATNVHCVSPTLPVCDNRNFWVSAYTERRILIEGWGYTPESNAAVVGSGSGVRSALPPDPERLAINDAAFQHPSAETVGLLVDTYGVDWMFVSKEYPADVAGLSSLTTILDKRFENTNYAVFKVIG
jgi:hypothetical protein